MFRGLNINIRISICRGTLVKCHQDIHANVEQILEGATD